MKSALQVVFACPLCPTTCSRRSDLRIHNERMHNAAGQLQCTKCAATFADRFSLREHAKSHRGQKCFACPRCPYQVDCDCVFEIGRELWRESRDCRRM
jgi:hypothetical protein